MKLMSLMIALSLLGAACSSKKKVKDIDQSDFAGEIERISNNYVMYSSWFKEE